MIKKIFVVSFFQLSTLGLLQYATAADPWADNVVSYEAGSAIVFGSDPLEKAPLTNFITSSAALGEPARYTSDDNPLTVILGADSPDDVVSIGEDGHLTVSFDEPVTDDPNNPYGIDLLIFGNAFLFDFPVDGTFDGVFGEAGIVEVSTDGQNFITVPGATPDGLFPTRGYLDDAAMMPTDFTLPVDPAFDPFGLTLEQVNAGYGNSGGGYGVDLADVQLTSITHVRISNPLVTDPNQTFSVTPEIDAIVDVAPVPEPSSLALMAFFGLSALHRKRR